MPTSAPERPDQPGRLDRMAERDPELARIVRANLAVYARRSKDAQTRDRVKDVLAGRRDLTEVLNSKEFTETVRGHLDNLLAGVELLTPEEKERAFGRAGEPTPATELAVMRDGAATGDGWATEDSAPATTSSLDRYLRPARTDHDDDGLLR